MIREYAFGFADRHHFDTTDKASLWYYVARDTFVSLFGYDKDVVEYFNKHKSLSGFDGKIYMPDEFLLDVDGTDIATARMKALSLGKLLEEKNVPYNTYFSGRGFHLGIPNTAFRYEPSQDLHLKVKDELNKHGIFAYADPSVTDKTRIIRLNNTLNTKSKLWKVFLKKGELDTMNALDIQQLAQRPRKDANIPILEAANPVFDCMARNKKKETKVYQSNMGQNPDPVNHPCISTMLQGTSFGNRHAVALRIAAWLRWRYPEHTVRLIMEDWRNRVSSDDHPFKKTEMDRIVTDCYRGHGGQGYRYGCMDNVMDSFCKPSCKLFQSKKSQSLMTASDMEASLMSFLSGDVKPINLGELYGVDFPIYPGELVVIQAPPKSMKTMLLQNWINALKKPTYFLEMEMSPRQIWQRFIQIENKWSEEDLREHYAKGTLNSFSDDFKWLYVDYAPCYAVELAKKISMLPVKPEIVVIDHMGLMPSKHRDLNMKMEEIAGALTDVAIKNNIIVFAVSEITKQAMVEGMNISSVRGSFRIAYNASKILSLTVAKRPNGDPFGMTIKTEANRERGALNVTLAINGTNIGKKE